MPDLFAYGTLMCEDIMEAVTGCRQPGEAGILYGFGRFCVRGEDYPALVAREESHVDGILYRDVSAAAWGRLDRFEGPMYRRQAVVVRLVSGAWIPAETYVVQPDSLGRLSARTWSYEDFLRGGKAHFIHTYGGYDAL